VSKRPHFGHTRQGLPVHARTLDHLPREHWYDRANSWLAVRITRGVGTMWCAYAFTGIALISLKATLSEHSVNADIQWVAQTFLQLVLLSVIIVGQNIGAKASDARAAKTLEDCELIADRLNLETRGGITEILNQIGEIRAGVAAIAAKIKV
jgi:hypothetical protein